MAIFVILNFEDANPGGAIAPAKLKKPSHRPPSVLGSAGATLKGAVMKAKAKEGRFGRNVVHHYSAVELIQADVAGTLTKDDVGRVRDDCARAEKIYIIMHGKPDDTEQGFANGGGAVATWRQLANFALKIFPLRDEPYRVVLVMCYGARTDNFRLNQLGALPPGELKTSFAYKFFRAICVARSVSMTACTGAISTGDDGINTVETEEWVAATLDVIDYKKDTATRLALEARMDQAKQAFINGGGTLAAWKAKVGPYMVNANQAATNDTERLIKQFAYERGHRSAALQAAKNQASALHAGAALRQKYGRIRYLYDGAQLQIINKYGDPLQPAVGNDYPLYVGPLL